MREYAFSMEYSTLRVELCRLDLGGGNMGGLGVKGKGEGYQLATTAVYKASSCFIY